MIRFPFSPYPRGWYQVATGREVKRGQLKSYRFFNKEIIVVRGQSGKAQVMDAHCPHLGAHLGKGGKVVGDSIQCPFHGWRFSQEGHCTQIPYCDHIPKNATLRKYPTLEVGPVIFAYQGHNDVHEPDFDLPACEEYSDPDWSTPQYLRYNLNSHVQEMAENTVDTGHFPLIHNYHQVPQMKDVVLDGTTFKITLEGQRKVFGMSNTISAELESRGLGVVFGKTETDFLSIRAIHAATPIDDNEIQVNVSFVFKKKNPILNLALKAFLPGEVFRFTAGDHLVLN
jgi:phenylpropionate dioxygenase-like ring-hydroxylating dioxygenase large terminal subunit